MAFVDTDNLKNVSWWFAKQRNLKILFKIDFKNTSDGNVFDNMTTYFWLRKYVNEQKCENIFSAATYSIMV